MKVVKIIKIIFGIMFILVGIIDFTSRDEYPSNAVVGCIFVIIGALLIISAFKASKKKHMYVQNSKIILKDGQKIPVDDIFKMFRYDKTGAHNYLVDRYNLKSSTAGYIIGTIYEQYYSSFLNWESTRKVNSFMEVDDSAQRIGIASPYTKPRWQIIEVFNFSDILSYELYDSGKVITKGGLGRALVGGALFGGAGAIVGSNVGKKTSKTSDYSVKITLRDTTSKPVFIKNITDRQTGEEILSALDQIVNQQNAESTKNDIDPDKIRKLKDLLDDGILTQEEFDIKKKELLGL